MRNRQRPTQVSSQDTEKLFYQSLQLLKWTGNCERLLVIVLRRIRSLRNGRRAFRERVFAPGRVNVDAGRHGGRERNRGWRGRC